MADAKSTRTVTVTNDEGFHLRAAMVLVKTARRFQSAITLVRGGLAIDGKSGPLQLLALGAAQGDQLTLEAQGPDAEAALETLVQLFAANFPDPDLAPRTETEAETGAAVPEDSD